MAQNLQNTINCTVPGLEEIIGSHSSVPECKDNISAFDTVKKYISVSYKFLENPNSLECQKPCLHTIFRSRVKKEHITSWVSDIEEDSFYLRIIYSTLNIEQNVETLAYDIGSFLTAMGGNLGLFLGFSCLSCILASIDFFAEKFVGLK